MIGVSNDAIRDAQRLVKSCLNFSPCEAASAACAGLIEAVKTGKVLHKDEVLLHLTGGGFDEMSDATYQPSAVEVGIDDHNPGLAAIKQYLA
jgi:threonine synthase